MRRERERETDTHSEREKQCGIDVLLVYGTRINPVLSSAGAVWSTRYYYLIPPCICSGGFPRLMGTLHPASHLSSPRIALSDCIGHGIFPVFSELVWTTKQIHDSANHF